MMAPSRQAIAVPELPPTRIQVLVVDDSAPVRDLLVSFFLRQKLAVTPASDGRMAIQILERSHGRFGLVMTDLNMPGADGFAVLMEAKRANPDCAVVIVTGYATLDSAIQAVRVGAYDYLPKPFSLSDVDRLLKRVATDRSWTRQQPPVPEPTPTASATPEQLTERIRELESRLASLGVQPSELGRDVDGHPTLY